MSGRHKQESARNGPRLLDGRESCASCDSCVGDIKAGWSCSLTGEPIPHPASGPVLMTCPQPRLPEEE